MKLILATLFAALTTSLVVVDGATRVAVIELGASTGTVRRTTSTDLETSVDGVASFWSALHGYGRKLQYAGMPVVPDLFSRPDSGVVVGLTGVDLDSMPTLSSLMNSGDGMTKNSDGDKTNDRVVGHMEVPGKQCGHMMKNVHQKESLAEPSAMVTSFRTHAHQSGISGIQLQVNSGNAADVDAQIASLLNDSSLAEDGKTVVLHLVVEEEDGAARRRNLARRLEEVDGEQAQDGANNNGEANNNAEADQQQQQQSNNGFYGYGYYNGYGEWVTPYKTMFQIQYFNVVLWTAVGLVAILFFGIYLMIYMPLMADTLLFGESARISIDD